MALTNNVINLQVRYIKHFFFPLQMGSSSVLIRVFIMWMCSCYNVSLSTVWVPSLNNHTIVLKWVTNKMLFLLIFAVYYHMTFSMKTLPAHDGLCLHIDSLDWRPDFALIFVCAIDIRKANLYFTIRFLNAFTDFKRSTKIPFISEVD